MKWIAIIVLVMIIVLAVWGMWNLDNEAQKVREEYEPLKKRALAIKTAEEYDKVVEDANEWRKKIFHRSQHGMVHELKGILQVKRSILEKNN